MWPPLSLTREGRNSCQRIGKQLSLTTSVQPLSKAPKSKRH
jgi:hypothetical protein